MMPVRYGNTVGSGDAVILITRPRRFGKTLTMSMVEQFFSLPMQDGKICLKGCPSGRIKNTGLYREHTRLSVCLL